MDFGGDLKILEPATIFQIFNMSMLTGVLEYASADKVASFYFEEGELVYTSMNNEKKKLGQFLIEKGWISEDQLEAALKEFKQNNGRERIGQILINRGFLDRNALVHAIQEQMKEVVYEVLTWREGSFEFVNELHPGDEDVLLDVSMSYLILEGMRRMDEKQPRQGRSKVRQ